MAELKYWLWLTSRRGMDSVRALKLLERFVTPEQVYYADQGDIAELGLSPNLERSLADKSMDAPEVILGECDRLDVRVMTIQDADYPMRLRQIADASGGRIVIGGVPPRTDDDFPSKKIKL